MKNYGDSLTSCNDNVDNSNTIVKSNDEIDRTQLSGTESLPQVITY